MKRVLNVLRGEAGRALAELVANRLDEPRAASNQRIAEGRVWLDGKRCRDPKLLLRVGQRIIVHGDASTTATVTPVAPSDQARHGEQEPAEPSPLLIAYRDADLAIVDKPSGLPSIAPQSGGPNLADALPSMLGREAKLLHRLDTGASGLLLVSLRAESRPMLAAQVIEHRLLRRYLALVAGHPEDDEQLIDLPLAARRAGAVVRPQAGGKNARTHVRVLRRGETLTTDGTKMRITLVQARLETGRMHQIRAHLSAIGHPLLGDDRYGGPPAERLALHAHTLGVAHPDGHDIELHSPLPAALRQRLPRWSGDRFGSP